MDKSDFGKAPSFEEIRSLITKPKGNSSSLPENEIKNIGFLFDKYVIAERKRVANMATERVLQKALTKENINKLIDHHPNKISEDGNHITCSCGKNTNNFIQHIKEL